MVKFRKQISVILIISFSLSLILNLFYNGNNKALAACPCPLTDGYCICDVTCQLGEEITTAHKSCFPEEIAGEFACGTEIPIGEVTVRTSLLARKMSEEFSRGIIDNANLMIEKTEVILNSMDNWGCETDCYTGCFKYYRITDGVLVTIPPQPADCQAIKSYNRDVTENCRNCQSPTECQAECNCSKCSDGCCWTDPSQKDSKNQPIACRYCPGQCQEDCVALPSQWRDDPFLPTLRAYESIENFQEDLRKTIDEVDQPDQFKIANLLEKLNFSRCELSKCYISAEEYPKVMAGEMTGKHLFTCQSVLDSGILEDDQIGCIVFQVMQELEEAESGWATFWAIIKGFFLILWQTIKTWLTGTQEEGCFPLNYYCCQF